MRRLVLILLASSLSVLPGAAQADGEALYLKHCSQCHGVDGAGAGYAADFVDPKPRDFTSGKYKIRTTPNGAVPTDADLRKILLEGMPYSSMPGWSHLPAAEIDALVTYIKTFSPRFEDPDYNEPAITIASPPAWTQASADAGKAVYAEIGCARCHGESGRGSGSSAPTLTDDWDNSLRAADLTRRWTFRGGPTRIDIFTRFSTGLNGTPMPSYADALEVDKRWQLVDYIVTLGADDAPGYDNLIIAMGTDQEISSDAGPELFEGAAPAHIALVGQIMEPGRQMVPSTDGVQLRAVYNRTDIAFELIWNDMRAEVRGHNAPNLEAPLLLAAASDDSAEEGGFWGDEAADDEGGDDFWGDEAADDAGDDFWGDEATDDGGGDDFWGEEGDDQPAATGAVTEFSDAIALQLPNRQPTGIKKPYFLFGDGQNAVDLWFADLAGEKAERWIARGSGEMAASLGEDLKMSAAYDDGQWRVVFVRTRRSKSEISFTQGEFLPIAVSVWDGFRESRGNRRALSQWANLYLEPMTAPSPLQPALKGAGLTFAVLLSMVFIARRRNHEL